VVATVVITDAMAAVSLTNTAFRVAAELWKTPKYTVQGLCMQYAT